MAHSIRRCGESRSFPTEHALLNAAGEGAAVLLLLGSDAGHAWRELAERDAYSLVLIELGDECLGVHTGEYDALEGGNVMGFARFRLGQAAPSDLVELVRQPGTPEPVIQQARALFEAHGLKTAVCGDFPGRIVNRLVRPYYNAALNKLDTGLASAADMDLTLRLGLGYPEGPIELLQRTGLGAHCQVSDALYRALGDHAFAPARRAQVARERGEP